VEGREGGIRVLWCIGLDYIVCNCWVCILRRRRVIEEYAGMKRMIQSDTWTLTRGLIRRLIQQSTAAVDIGLY
jgi:hypothetical protein